LPAKQRIHICLRRFAGSVRQWQAKSAAALQHFHCSVQKIKKRHEFHELHKCRFLFVKLVAAL
jgi:hypothetical protein